MALKLDELRLARKRLDNRPQDGTLARIPCVQISLYGRQMEFLYLAEFQLDRLMRSLRLGLP